MAVAKHEKWSSGLTFLLAAVGSAVGLGNIWRFPYVVGENGGGAFVLLYIGMVILFGIPVVMTELMIGRRYQMSPVNSLATIGADKPARRLWNALGWSYVLVPIGILSFYGVVAGWTLNYVVKMGSGSLSGLDSTAVEANFNGMMSDPVTMIFWQTVAMLITMGIVARGVKGGLEKAVEILMPALFIILLVLVAYALYAGNVTKAVDFLFTPDFSKINAKSVLEAAGQAFFSLSLGSGAIMTYGAYLTKDISIPKMSCGVAFADTLVALLAGLAIFPIVFANGLDPEAGPGLVFVTLPIVFDTMPFGQVFGVLFFLLITFAAVTSTISLLEPMVSYLEERVPHMRLKMTFLAGAVTWAIGILAALSLNVMSDFRPLGMFKTFETMGIFDLLDYFSANVFMMLNGLLIAIFAGWIMKRTALLEELGLADSWLFKFWRLLIKVVVPIGLGYIFWDFITT
ncbi:sodium-dependent transporter [Emcibacter sp.]|uniref:sodium-dependent transporter n=1 Tax=Emcibacter sp. TaxID=1979954 RepID=UPI002AA852A0|nr:sodium-dependent transporter [Emcibacter sp.]